MLLKIFALTIHIKMMRIINFRKRLTLLKIILECDKNIKKYKLEPLSYSNKL